MFNPKAQRGQVEFRVPWIEGMHPHQGDRLNENAQQLNYMLKQLQAESTMSMVAWSGITPECLYICQFVKTISMGSGIKSCFAFCGGRLAVRPQHPVYATVES